MCFFENGCWLRLHPMRQWRLHKRTVAVFRRCAVVARVLNYWRLLQYVPMLISTQRDYERIHCCWSPGIPNLGFRPHSATYGLVLIDPVFATYLLWFDVPSMVISWTMWATAKVSFITRFLYQTLRTFFVGQYGPHHVSRKTMVFGLKHCSYQWCSRSKVVRLVIPASGAMATEFTGPVYQLIPMPAACSEAPWYATQPAAWKHVENHGKSNQMTQESSLTRCLVCCSLGITVGYIPCACDCTDTVAGFDQCSVVVRIC